MDLELEVKILPMTFLYNHQVPQTVEINDYKQFEANETNLVQWYIQTCLKNKSDL